MKHYLDCKYCHKHVQLPDDRFVELFDKGELPVCRECRRYLTELEGSRLFDEENAESSPEMCLRQNDRRRKKNRG